MKKNEVYQWQKQYLKQGQIDSLRGEEIFGEFGWRFNNRK